MAFDRDYRLPECGVRPEIITYEKISPEIGYLRKKLRKKPAVTDGPFCAKSDGLADRVYLGPQGLASPARAVGHLRDGQMTIPWWQFDSDQRAEPPDMLFWNYSPGTDPPRTQL